MREGGALTDVVSLYKGGLAVRTAHGSRCLASAEEAVTGVRRPVASAPGLPPISRLGWCRAGPVTECAHPNKHHHFVCPHKKCKKKPLELDEPGIEPGTS